MCTYARLAKLLPYLRLTALSYFMDSSKCKQLGCCKVGTRLVIDKSGKELLFDHVGLGPRVDVFNMEMLVLVLVA